MSGDTDPHFYGQKEPLSSSVAFKSAQQAQSANLAPQEQKQSVLQRYSSKDSVYKNQGKGTATLFDEKPNNLSSFIKDDWNRTRGTGIAEVAGSTDSIREFADKVNNTRKNGYVLTPREKQLYGFKGVADVAGNGDLYDWTKDVKDFFATNSELDTPYYNSLNKRKNKITNTVKYDPTVYENSENSLAWIPKWKNKNKIGQNISDSYWKGEEFLNQEEFDDSLDALFAASFNRFRGTPANVLSGSFDIIADCVDELDEDKKSDFTDWLRSMEDNSEMLNKSERQYSQVDFDNDFLTGLVVGTSKSLVDLSSSSLWGGIVNIPPQYLSAIHSATDIYSANRENGYSVGEALWNSGMVTLVNQGANAAFSSLQKHTNNRIGKSLEEIIKNTTTETVENTWYANVEDGSSLSNESIATTLAVATAVETITKGGSALLKFLAHKIL